MKITKIQVSAGRTFNHPYESYANFRFDITLMADLAPDEDSQACVYELQEHAEALADARKQRILDRCETRYQCEQLRYEITNLTRQRQEWEKESDPQAEAEALLKRAMAKEAAERKLKELLQKLGEPISDEPVLHPGHPDHPETHERH